MATTADARALAFERRPHRTLLALSAPVMLSLIVEPLAGLVDTAFVERLGAAPLAALGAATALLSSVLWVFNFLAIGSQTEVAQAEGRGDRPRARRAASTALILAGLSGVALALALAALLHPAAAWMSDVPEVRHATVVYLAIRLVGAPAGLVTLAAFGVLRGTQEMRAPLAVAAAVSALNVLLDPLLIFGPGPFPRLGVAGAALATAGSQLFGAVAAVMLVRRRIGLVLRLDGAEARRLVVVGRDMVIRTGAALAFLLLATRAAIRAGVAAGAAHQAVRQVWILLAFLLDAYATAAQSLVGFFLGAGDRRRALRVAAVSCAWGLGTGFVLSVVLWLVEPAVAALLVPEEARAPFGAAWKVCTLMQPVNALSFVTDGIHWGAGRYAFLRNVMLFATASGVLLLALIPETSPRALLLVWLATAGWIAIRAGFGVSRLSF
ncbi:MAG: MATE family efflux transporter [Acidobacteria bacterium]|nr:MAG: MATE family efflux transporter [Acidobacteriota bacterium]